MLQLEAMLTICKRLRHVCMVSAGPGLHGVCRPSGVMPWLKHPQAPLPLPLELSKRWPGIRSSTERPQQMLPGRPGQPGGPNRLARYAGVPILAAVSPVVLAACRCVEPHSALHLDLFYAKDGTADLMSL